MISTPFPTRPIDVAALSVQEFSIDLTFNNAPSLDVACRRFADDANRALVWWIRFSALKAWCAQTEMAGWLDGRSGTSKDVCEVAASFELNDRWEFDAHHFCSAIDRLVSRRSRTARGGSIR
jgi:hypothetical protein